MNTRRCILLLVTGALAILAPAGSAADDNERLWRMIGDDPANTPESAGRAQHPTGECASACGEVGRATTAGDVQRRRRSWTAPCTSATSAACCGNSTPTPARCSGRIWSSDYTGIAGDIVPHEPVARGQHARRRRSSSIPNMLGDRCQRPGSSDGSRRCIPIPKGDHDRFSRPRRQRGLSPACPRQAQAVRTPPSAARSSQLTRTPARSSGRRYSLPGQRRPARRLRRRHDVLAARCRSASRGLVYGTFGQPYTEPASVTACHAANGGFSESCEQPGAYLKSIVAFDMKTGQPRWSYRVQGHEPVAARVRQLSPPVGDVVPGRVRRRKMGSRRFGRQRHARSQHSTDAGAHVVGVGGRAAFTRCSMRRPASSSGTR